MSDDNDVSYIEFKSNNSKWLISQSKHHQSYIITRDGKSLVCIRSDIHDISIFRDAIQKILQGKADEIVANDIKTTSPRRLDKFNNRILVAACL